MTPTSTRATVTAMAALVAGAAPYVGPGTQLNTLPIVEVVDHVIPAAATLTVAVVAAVRGRIGLVVAVVILLSGLWMAGTHVPLLLQVPRHQVELAVALVHALPGVGLLGLGIVAVRSWAAPPDPAGRDGPVEVGGDAA